MSDDIQRLIQTISQPGTPSELTSESLAVDAIASAMTTNGSPMFSKFPRFSTNSKRSRVAAFVAAGVIGFGGVAAAGPAVLDQIESPDVPDEVVVATTEVSATSTTEVESPSTTEVTETTSPATSAPEDTTPPTSESIDDVTPSTEVDDTGVIDVDDPDTDFDENDCAEGNHGKTVSSVARTEDRSSDDVVDAAHSNCGKDDDDDAEDDEDEDHDDDSDDQSDDDDDDDSDNSGRGNSDDDDSDNSGRGNSNDDDSDDRGKSDDD